MSVSVPKSTECYRDVNLILCHVSVCNNHTNFEVHSGDKLVKKTQFSVSSFQHRSDLTLQSRSPKLVWKCKPQQRLCKIWKLSLTLRSSHRLHHAQLHIGNAPMISLKYTRKSWKFFVCDLAHVSMYTTNRTNFDLKLDTSLLRKYNWKFYLSDTSEICSRSPKLAMKVWNPKELIHDHAKFERSSLHNLWENSNVRVLATYGLMNTYHQIDSHDISCDPWPSELNTSPMCFFFNSGKTEMKPVPMYMSSHTN